MVALAPGWQQWQQKGRPLLWRAGQEQGLRGEVEQEEGGGRAGGGQDEGGGRARARGQGKGRRNKGAGQGGGGAQGKGRAGVAIKCCYPLVKQCPHTLPLRMKKPLHAGRARQAYATPAIDVQQLQRSTVPTALQQVPVGAGVGAAKSSPERQPANTGFVGAGEEGIRAREEFAAAPAEEGQDSNGGHSCGDADDACPLNFGP